MAGLPKIKLKAEIPESLKAENATTKWGKILSVTPVVMTVIATMLAGLSSSEMTRAQYDRSLAAQRQSKAGDQWSFFQAKRLRGVVLRSTLDTMLVSAGVRPLDPAGLRGVLTGATFEPPSAQAALAALRDGTVPKPASTLALAPTVRAALTALEESKTDDEVATLLSQIPSSALDDALRDAQANVQAFDAQLKPINQAIDAWEKQLSSSAGDAALRRDFVAARMNYNSQRYDAEARLNQTIAQLFELQVRTSNISADRHHRRSSRFFYGMLAAQLAVIVSTLAMAAQKRNLLWSIAAGAGLIAVAFTVYVLVYV